MNTENFSGIILAYLFTTKTLYILTVFDAAYDYGTITEVP
jgi:hypothetical protein